jgi:myo-inositol 2-dehydrogenase / D-chiro-inositol 1-dehydrogenase
MGATQKNESPLKTAALAATTLAVAGVMANKVYAKGSDIIKVGLLGCGGRGSQAIEQNLNADPGTVVVAVADLFENKARARRGALIAKYKDRAQIPDDNVFSGFDCHLKLAQCNADLLCMATAPGFRGRQLMAAIKAGKHVFTEKPVGTDVAGCKEVIEASKLAEQKGLAIVAGTQRRHEPGRMELMKYIHDGAIGELVGGQCYWYGDGIWYRGYEKGMTELEWQCHNWYHFTWASGDQICEQHIHNIDVINWCFDGPPKKITAIGGRQTRDYSGQAKDVCRKFNGNENGWEKYNGDIYDHITAEFEYANGARCMSFSGHGPGQGRGGEKILGTKGSSDCAGGYSGEKSWRYKGPNPNPYDQEHADLLKSIRDGKPLNEGVRVAESCLTAIAARLSAYTGKPVTWDWLMKECKQNLVPPQAEMKAGPGRFYPIPTGSEKLE